ncbi:MAG: hypothetical protein JEY99_08705 [Spirochaetales bacterium]|nr:hypothetical protein [Spirochaetales bacterium]
MKILHPETFQGNLKRKKYFEGWYYKIVSGSDVYAFIPGLALGKDSHAFIQIIDGKSHDTAYIRFPIEEFNCKPGSLDLRIGNNRFTGDGLSFDEQRDSISLQGKLTFTGITPYPVTPSSPGIMGIFGYLPLMECYHGVVSVDHKVEGELIWNGKTITVNQGRGYIEKDWGRSMPSSWIWMQSNIFKTVGTSFMLSIARIPFLGSSFKGHLGFFYHQNIFYPFATYNGSRYTITEDSINHRLQIKLENRKNILEISTPDLLSGGELMAPVEGGMERRIREQTNASIHIRLLSRDGECIFEETGESCGLEITGKMAELI